MTAGGLSAHMRPMSTVPTPVMPSRVAARTATAVAKLSPEQLHAILIASTHRSGRILTNLWDTVRVADPVLADTLDDLHARKAPEDSATRFAALQELHAENVAAVAKTRTGRRVAARIWGAFVLAVASVLAGLVGILSVGLAASGLAVAAVLAVAGVRAGQRMAESLPTRKFSDPELAASIVWDTAVDAAASAALRHREGEAGLTPDVLRALSLTWTSAGLSLDLLVPVVRPKKATGEAPAAKRTAAKRAPKADTVPARSNIPEPAAA